jgi:hypothetical protein
MQFITLLQIFEGIMVYILVVLSAGQTGDKQLCWVPRRLRWNSRLKIHNRECSFLGGYEYAAFVSTLAG